MQLINTKYLIRNAAERWRLMYEPFKGVEFNDRKKIYENLLKLNPNTSTKADVHEAIFSVPLPETGHINSDFMWTSIKCRECNMWVDSCVVFGNGAYQFEICNACLNRASKIVSLKKSFLSSLFKFLKLNNK